MDLRWGPEEMVGPYYGWTRGGQYGKSFGVTGQKLHELLIWAERGMKYETAPWRRKEGA